MGPENISRILADSSGNIFLDSHSQNLPQKVNYPETFRSTVKIVYGRNSDQNKAGTELSIPWVPRFEFS